MTVEEFIEMCLEDMRENDWCIGEDRFREMAEEVIGMKAWERKGPRWDDFEDEEDE